jgi:hypothetical protein
MAKMFEVTFVPQALVPLYSLQTHAFQLPEPREFGSRERAEEYARKIKEQWPTALSSIRETEGD